MLYAPPDRTLGLWDTWLFQQGDTMHLFYLQRERQEVDCSTIAHAVTRDWLHWETLPPVLSKGTGSAWDAGPLMTGMTLEHDGRYFMFYGAMVDRVQRIGLATSDDLFHWEKVSTSPLLEAAGPWYETDPAQAVNYETAWRDPYVFYHAPDACFYAFICARAASAGDTGGGCIAVARSTDLLDWSLLPPAHVSDSITCLEVPEYFNFNGRHYLSYTTSYHFGTPYPVSDPYQATGTFYLVSDQMLAGYEPPPHPNALSAGPPNPITNYVGRSIPAPGDTARIYYYQHVYPPLPGESLYGALSAPKLLAQGADDRLVLSYADFVLEPHTQPPVTLTEPLGPDTLLAIAHEDAPDGIFEADVTSSYAGICFRLGPGREGMLEGLAVWIAPDQQDSAARWVMLGTVHFSPGPDGLRPALGGPSALHKLDLTSGYHNKTDYALRAVMRGPFVDVYVDDVLCLTHTYMPETLPTASSTGAFYAGLPKDNPVTRFSVRRMTDEAIASKLVANDWR